MKTLLVTVSLALAGVSSAQAQIFRPSVGGSAAVGAIAGGLIGGHNGDRWAEGAVIGGGWCEPRKENAASRQRLASALLEEAPH